MILEGTLALDDAGYDLLAQLCLGTRQFQFVKKSHGAHGLARIITGRIKNVATDIVIGETTDRDDSDRDQKQAQNNNSRYDRGWQNLLHGQKSLHGVNGLPLHSLPAKVKIH